MEMTELLRVYDLSQAADGKRKRKCVLLILLQEAAADMSPVISLSCFGHGR